MQLAPRLVSTALLAAASLASLTSLGACRREDGAPGSGAALTASVAPITACPEGAHVEGEAPAAGVVAPASGFRQRCQRDETTRHGASREWYGDGRERAYSEWWEGEKHGRFRIWFANGQLRAEGAHRFGHAAGHWRYFDERGVLLQERTFELAAPQEEWLARAIGGQAPVRDVPETGRVDGGDGDGADGERAVAAPAAPVAPVAGTVQRDPAAGAPAPTPAPPDPVFTRGAAGGG